MSTSAAAMEWISFKLSEDPLRIFVFLIVETLIIFESSESSGDQYHVQ
jgi:hypothetical protein